MPVEPILIRRRFGLPPSPLRRLRPARRGVACVAIAVWFAAGVVAQGPLKRDRWRFAHLQSLREVLWTKTQGADARTAAAIEAAFAAPTRGRIFTPIVAAFAALEANSASSKSTPDAVEPSATQPDAVAPENDAIGRLATRLVLHGYSVPEVVDPESTLEICREYHVSAGLASLRPDLEPLAALILEVFAADREPSNSATEATVDPLFRQVIETGVSSDDLLRFLPRFTVPTTAWEDGAYTWQLRAVFKADAPPSPVDPNGGRPPESTLDPAAWRVLSEPTWATGRFLVTRGYQQRAEGLFAQAKGLVETASPVDRAALVSALAQTGEAYAGEPPLPHRDPVEALTRLKRMIDNVQEERFAWDGIDGWMTIGAPVSATTDGPDEYLRVALRLPTDASMAQLSDARRSDGERSAVGAMVPTTLVIVVPGSAAFDVIGDRPESPRTVDPLATAIHLHPPSASPDGLAGTDALCVAVMEAPGGSRRSFQERLTPPHGWHKPSGVDLVGTCSMWCGWGRVTVLP